VPNEAGLAPGVDRPQLSRMSTGTPSSVGRLTRLRRWLLVAAFSVGLVVFLGWVELTVTRDRGPRTFGALAIAGLAALTVDVVGNFLIGRLRARLERAAERGPELVRVPRRPRD
jgi:hypothetical protein